MSVSDATRSQLPVSSFEPLVFDTLKSKYRQLASEALPQEGETDAAIYKIFQAIVNQDLASLQSVATFTSVREIMLQRQKDTQEEMRKKLPQLPDITFVLEGYEIDEELASFINNQDAKSELTPLHIAVMTYNVAAARFLLESVKCEVNKQDAGQATPLHHAAVLNSRELIQLLLQHGADGAIQDAYGGTYQDILDLCYHQINPAAQAILKRGDQIEEVNFYETTNAYLLSTNNIVSPLLWLTNWEKSGNIQKLTSYEKALQKMYLEFSSKNPPQVWMDFDPQVGHFLRAGENIPQFTIVGEYFGKIDPEELDQKFDEHDAKVKEGGQSLSNQEAPFFYVEDPNLAYGLESIDAYKFRGLMGLVPDSFPNMIVQPVKLARGVYNRSVFIAAKDIKKGGVLAFDYGREHDVKLMPFKELRQDAMEDFFRRHTQEELLAFLNASFDPPQDFQRRVSVLANEAYVKHLLNTPTAMLSLYLKEIVSLPTLKGLFSPKPKNNDPNFVVFDKLYFYKGTMQRKFFDALEKFDKACQEKDPQVVSAKREELQAKIGQCPTLELFQALSDF